MSVVLLITATILTGYAQPQYGDDVKLKTSGVLQLTWLLGTKAVGMPYSGMYSGNGGDGSLIASRLRTEAESADIADLRKVGKDILVEGWGARVSTRV